jgi:Protein of unknown function (DUF3175)
MRCDVANSDTLFMRKRKINREAAMLKSSKSSPDNRWSGRVTKESSALDLEKGVFTWKDPKRIALSLKQSADSSTRRKTPPFRSAMSMIVFYINRAGKNLDKDRLRILEQAKEELRTLYGKIRYE